MARSVSSRTLALGDLERRHLIALIGSEAAHELTTPLNFFEHLLRQVAQGTPLSEREIQVGLEQVERCRRLVEVLRRPRLPNVKVESVTVRAVVESAIHVVRATLE